MLLTGNFNLRKPELGEPVDVQDLNYNADIIDKELNSRPASDGNASEMTVEFETITQLTELTSNDSLKGLFGKLKLAVKKLLELIEEVAALKKSVSDGKTLVANAITGQGVSTAADATFATMAANITSAGNARYDAGVTAADARVNTSSVNYQSGYNAGYSAANPGDITFYAQIYKYSGSGHNGYTKITVPNGYTHLSVSADAHINLGTSNGATDYMSYSTSAELTVPSGLILYATRPADGSAGITFTFSR